MLGTMALARACSRPTSARKLQLKCLASTDLLRDRIRQGEALLQLREKDKAVQMQAAAALIREAKETIERSRDFEQLRDLLRKAIDALRSQAVTGGLPSASANCVNSHDAFSQIVEMRAFGLGSLYQYLVPQQSRLVDVDKVKRGGMRLYQIGLTLAFKDLFCSLQTPLIAADPAFTPFDRDLLESFGVSATTDPSIVDQLLCFTTFCYMPCCPRELYNQLLTANMPRHRLGNVLVYGTSFSSMHATSMLFNSLSGAEGDACMTKLCGKGCVQEFFAPDFGAHGIGMGLHCFPPNRLTRL